MSSQKRASGPFDDHINSGLEACFGDVGGLKADFGSNSFNQSINAVASTAGSAMSFGSDLGQDPSDPFAMEVIGHEVAHALAGGGSGKTSIDEPGDPGEAGADHAGQQFAAFMTGGGPAPTLSPAHGGQAAIHRFESSEHVNAVAGAGDRMLLLARRNGTLTPEQSAEIQKRLDSGDQALQDEWDLLQQTPDNELPAAHEVNPAVNDMMTRPITLANGVPVTPGQITAMMGDFFGVFDADGNLDPLATFEQMNNANPDEIRALQGLLDREASGIPIDQSEWEQVSRMHADDTRDFNHDGIADNLTYFDIAAKNDSHFSGPSMDSGVDNNMGVYTILHQAALQAAEGGDVERARALESSSMHYLTDRHSSGHAFNKAGVMENAGQNTTPTGTIPIYAGIGLSGGIDAPTSQDQMDAIGWASSDAENVVQNGATKVVHDQFNEEGIRMSNARGESWTAYGDDHWNDDGNTANRFHTAESAYGSFAELEAVASHRTTAAEVQDQGFSAYQSVDLFDQETQDEAERRSRDVSPTESVRHLAESGLSWGLVGMYAQDGLDWAADNIPLNLMPYGPTFNETRDGLNWAGEQIVDGARWVGDKATQGAAWAGEKVDQGVDWAADTWDRGTNWAGEQVDNATSWVGDKAQGVADTVTGAAGFAMDTARDVGQAAGDAWDSASSWVTSGVSSWF